MLVYEQPELAGLVLREARQSAARYRLPGLHVSDLTQCLRKTWWKQHGQGIDHTDDDHAVLLLGQSHHLLLQPEKNSEIVVYVPVNGKYITGTIDAWTPGKTPFQWPSEIKTTRSDDLKEPVFGMTHYVEQLISYCMATNQTKGLPGTSSPRRRCYVCGNWSSPRGIYAIGKMRWPDA
jgi:hypothetical protein